jgi:ribosome-associated protein
MRIVDVTRVPLELFKILKFEGLVGSGGEAKFAIADGKVTVNGEVETRKRRKIVSGDVIGFASEEFQIELKSVPG